MDNNEGFVVCGYCGQSLMCDEDLTEAQKKEYAKENCDCDSAKAYKKIDNLFGHERNGVPPFGLKKKKMLFDLAMAMLSFDIAGVTIMLNGTTKAQMAMNGKDKLVIKRNDTETTQETV